MVHWMHLFGHCCDGRRKRWISLVSTYMTLNSSPITAIVYKYNGSSDTVIIT